jgi:DNA-binding CsgD family transcriptional regulator
MASVEDFSRVVSGIYAATVAPDTWEATLREIHQMLGGTAGGLCTPSGTVWSIEKSVLPAEATQSYTDHYCRLDHVLDMLRYGGVGAIRTGTELIDPYRRTEFYAGWIHPYQLDDGLFVRLGNGTRPTCFVVAAPRRTESFDTMDRLKMLGGLVPHLQQSLRIGRKLGVLSDHIAELTGALEVIRHGILIVADDLLVVSLNSAAERILRTSDGLCTRSGQIAAMSTGGDRELRSAIANAVVGDGSGVRGSRSFTCGRPSGKRPYILHVLPSRRHLSDEPAPRAMALLLVIDPENEPEPALTMLRRLYRLTETEADVALHMMHGADLKQIAEMLTVSVTTVRTHLQHVFDKTDTHRQAELVHLLHIIEP